VRTNSRLYQSIVHWVQCECWL